MEYSPWGTISPVLVRDGPYRGMLDCEFMPTVTTSSGFDTMTKAAETKVSSVVGAVDGFVTALVESCGDPTLGAQQIRLLTALYLAGSLNQIDLPKYTGVERSANSRNISRLGDGGWVENRASGVKRHEPGLGLVEGYEEPTDRRFKMVRLTPKGRAVVEAAAKASRMG
jgi:DNA-binding MarR family transcriptional regulator